jgi:hypothetical protein
MDSATKFIYSASNVFMEASIDYLCVCVILLAQMVFDKAGITVSSAHIRALSDPRVKEAVNAELDGRRKPAALGGVYEQAYPGGVGLQSCMLVCASELHNVP